MKELIYQVEFLSDIVLPASSNTEGNIEQLDFIAGSNFLGIVAQNYTQFEDSFNIFHSGTVKFGDATLLLDSKITYKMPLSFFHEKADNSELYNHHLIKDFKPFIQLKQKRKGYITEDLDVIYIDYNYSQKSAYDKENRRSKDSSMFGYMAMKKGLEWQFSIKVDDSISDKDFKLLKESIQGTKRLGKSKSAEYGLVNIKFIGSEALALPKNSTNDKNTFLYLNSRVALTDKEGNPTYDLTYLFDGLTDENIEYSKCQIKTVTFTPYNRARETKDYEKICIEKGSVIVLKDVNIKDIPQYTGAYQSQGFGELLINPTFLQRDKFKFNLGSETLVLAKQPIKTDISKFLQHRENLQKNKLDILNEVDDFIRENKKLYKKIKPSQWGQIRSICSRGESNFKEEIGKYISKGIKEWEDKQIKTLLQDKHSLEFIKLISIQMPKEYKDDK